MAANQPSWPREWLMTDERIGEHLWEAIDRLPEGAGVVFRHYATPKAQRAALAHQVAERCLERGLILGIAQDVALASSLNAALVHNADGDPAGLPTSRSAHSVEEARFAIEAGAALIFLSPLFTTRSHPGRESLSHELARRIVVACPVPVIALGGMNRARFEELSSDGFYGWAGIDAWLEEGRAVTE
ncbi:thiamine phosphate synthase [Sphingomonas sp. NSE70-1]|uniref:Thiamine phosphate synthase n=1 Tax=Sphingomonas caseinilyticus TaxID=2908205 RepID=A0ABT0RV08_9SPHN|nr:thiamine phosphate synthase [Sphingomonas caseinilyticus]MCL6698786.1 thiamine phosphate synthase [Sphingomonas caseinilyticus]